ARSMAAGVSLATVPTMAGMVGALSGVFASTWLNRKSTRELEIFRDSMTTDH
ncbi:MAG: MotA/TolQ/ExbB proton channel family protein, partial [Gammaproteobacteria bacterium]|nr:MotA/TolQ/ExbB proton channel family protein [Gammaproteobacteria bacterium]